MGSFAEIETQVILSTELGYIRASLTEELMAELQTLGRMLRGLAKSIDKRRHV
jgi:four helix bundle protein